MLTQLRNKLAGFSLTDGNFDNMFMHVNNCFLFLRGIKIIYLIQRSARYGNFFTLESIYN